MIITQPKAPGFGRRRPGWSLAAPPDSVAPEKMTVWRAGHALNLPLDLFSIILGQAPSTVKGWCALQTGSRSRGGQGYIPSGLPLMIATATIEGIKRNPNLATVVSEALQHGGAKRAIFEILKASVGETPPQTYEPSLDPYHRTQARREATTARHVKAG